jgi:hypothetical protein
MLLMRPAGSCAMGGGQRDASAEGWKDGHPRRSHPIREKEHGRAQGYASSILYFFPLRTDTLSRATRNSQLVFHLL